MSESWIKVLPDDLINKIAAGEVVERPASVVKELVENSIDAGARQILIEIENSGKKLIRVSDNGEGLTDAEIKLALQRHSTSKITSAADLFHINTLGFRGEALPSIASVSKLKIIRNPSGQGITVEVRDLFYNTPARKKFLKSDATEMGHIGDLAAKYAIAYPERSFKLNSDGRPLIVSGGSGNMIDALVAVYGAEIAKGLIPVDGESRGVKVSGFISRPSLSRIDKSYEVFYVNGRYIKNFLLNRALEEAFRTLIPGGRYPIGILLIKLDPAQVDVNVHPTKREIKFQKNQEVMEAVRLAACEALAKVVEAGNWEAGNEAGNQPTTNEFTDQLSMSGFNAGAFTQTFPSDTQAFQLERANENGLIPLQQLNNAYIVATDGESIVFIDQHAAHERILFDRLDDSSPAAKQSLLLPINFELPADEAAILADNLVYLTSLGYEIEHFGGNSFLLRSTPFAPSKISPEQSLRDIVAEIKTLGRALQPEERKEKIRKLVACHSAIKAGDRLNTEEINQLIRDLYLTPHPFTCPHGRPTMIRITTDELWKRFGR